MINNKLKMFESKILNVREFPLRLYIKLAKCKTL